MLDRSAVSERMRGYTIGGVRILAGLLWLANIHWKVPTDFGKATGGGLYKYIASGATNAPFAPYRWVLREMVIPHFELFGWFTLIIETALAGLLLIGYRTRIVALIGAAQAIPIGLAVIYYPKGDEWSWSYLMMIGLHLLLWAVAAGEYLGVDGVLAGARKRSNRALRSIGLVALAVGVVGLFVARSIDFAGKKAALLGSDAGFMKDGKLVRRWELKFLWFNPFWALLTILLAVLLIVGARRAIAAWLAVAGFGAIAIIVFVTNTFDYVRDDGVIQKVATGSNAAFWGGLALAGALFAKRAFSIDEPTAAE